MSGMDKNLELFPIEENQLKAIYMRSNQSLAKMSEELGKPLRTLEEMSKRGKWVECRSRYQTEVAERAIKDLQKEDAARIKKLLRSSDVLKEKVIQDLLMVDEDGNPLVNSEGVKLTRSFNVKDLKDLVDIDDKVIKRIGATGDTKEIEVVGNLGELSDAKLDELIQRAAIDGDFEIVDELPNGKLSNSNLVETKEKP